MGKEEEKGSGDEPFTNEPSGSWEVLRVVRVDSEGLRGFMAGRGDGGGES